MPASVRADAPKTVGRVAGFDVDVIGDLQGFALDLTPQRVADGLDTGTHDLGVPVSGLLSLERTR